VQSLTDNGGLGAVLQKGQKEEDSQVFGGLAYEVKCSGIQVNKQRGTRKALKRESPAWFVYVPSIDVAPLTSEWTMLCSIYAVFSWPPSDRNHYVLPNQGRNVFPMEIDGMSRAAAN